MGESALHGVADDAVSRLNFVAEGDVSGVVFDRCTVILRKDGRQFDSAFSTRG